MHPMEKIPVLDTTDCGVTDREFRVGESTTDLNKESLNRNIPWVRWGVNAWQDMTSSWGWLWDSLLMAIRHPLTQYSRGPGGVEPAWVTSTNPANIH